MNLLSTSCKALLASVQNLWSNAPLAGAPEVAASPSVQERPDTTFTTSLNHSVVRITSLVASVFSASGFTRFVRRRRKMLILLGTCLIGHHILFQTPHHYIKKHITYDDEFETNNLSEHFYHTAMYFNLSKEGLPDLPNHLAIGFINGIRNHFNDTLKNARYLSHLAGGYNIHGVYNPTHGVSADLQEYWSGLNYVGTAPVRKLKRMWSRFFKTSSLNATFLTICHSQGAVLVRNALLDYAPKLRNRIFVLAIAPGGYIHQNTCAEALHYKATWWRDFVPYFDQEGRTREAHTTKELPSAIAAAFFDHEFMSATYKQVLQHGITTYIQTNGVSIV